MNNRKIKPFQHSLIIKTFGLFLISIGFLFLIVNQSDSFLSRVLNGNDRPVLFSRIGGSNYDSAKEFQSQIPIEMFSNGSLKNYPQDHSSIIKYIQQHHLSPPSAGPYKFDKYPQRIGEDRITSFVMQLLKNKRNGFFIECGANDGEFLSNSITLEMEHGWSGLLVESDPSALATLKTRNRKAWVADVCLSVLPYPHKVDMIRTNGWSPMSYVLEDSLPDQKKSEVATTKSPNDLIFSALCFPLYSILMALNVSEVDYFSLDVEGAELAILKTFPFESKNIIIKVISTEVRAREKSTFVDLIKFLKPRGYRVMAYILAEYTHDLIFVHDSVNTSMTPVPANDWV